MYLSIVIPVYRASKGLYELFDQIKSDIPSNLGKFEIIFIDDCSPDNSWAVIQQLVRENPEVSGIQLQRNFGQHNALLCGIKHTKGDVIVTMDDDLQHPPSEIENLIDELNRGHDVVYGAPQKQSHNIGRAIASTVTKWVLKNTMGAENASYVSAFRVFEGSLRDQLVDYKSPTVNLDILLSWVTTRFSVVRVKHDKRKYGNSGYSFGKLLQHSMNLMTGYSTLPLQLASIVGVFFALFGLSILLYVLINYVINGAAVQGFAFLASMVSIFSGVQLFTLGIFGEYLARIHQRSMQKPQYVVRNRI
jgi:undecaprenyl-phosphate 4-deoxy-4-formamido-L-arabinose transferase